MSQQIMPLGLKFWQYSWTELDYLQEVWVDLTLSGGKLEKGGLKWEYGSKLSLHVSTDLRE